MRRFAIVAVVLGAAGLAEARPITAGASLGMAQSKSDSAADANNTMGLFGRLNLNARVAGQLELLRISSDDDTANLRTGTALLVIDLAQHGRLMPILLAGFGLDSSVSQFDGSYTGHHIEGGLGLEYRSAGGLNIGIDGRLGGRTIDSSDVVQPQPLPPGTAFFVPNRLTDGEYRQIRLTVGVRF